MRTLIALLACVVFLGCDYTVPLSDTPAEEINKQLLGVWEAIPPAASKPAATQPAQLPRLVILPFNDREYMIAYQVDDKDKSEHWYAKGWLVTCAGKRMVQVKWIGTSKEAPLTDKRAYQLFTYSQTGNQLIVRSLNTDVVSRDIETSAELAKAIESNKDNPKLFRDPIFFGKFTAK